MNVGDARARRRAGDARDASMDARALGRRLGGNFDRSDRALAIELEAISNRSRVKMDEKAIARALGANRSPTNVLEAASRASSESGSADELEGDRMTTGELVDDERASERRRADGLENEDSNGARFIRPMAPSVDHDALQKRVSELRTALGTAERVLDRTQSRLELAEGAKRAAEAESATLRARIRALEGAGAPLRGRESDASLVDARGRLLEEATVELSHAAKATCAAKHEVEILRADCKKLQDTIAALSAASTEENNTLSMELAQARMRIRGDAREISALKERVTQSEANVEKLKGCSQLASDATSRYQLAEKDASQAKQSLAETMRHNEFLQGRVTELEEIIKSNGTAHYEQELRRVREHLGADISRITAELKQERAARKAMELELSAMVRTNETNQLPTVDDDLQSERSKNAQLTAEIESLKRQLARDVLETQKPNSTKDEWSDALGLLDDGKDVEDEPVSPSKTSLAVRDALLEAARLEVEKLGDMNRKLVLAKLTAERDSVSKREYEAALMRNNEAWAAKAAEIECEGAKNREQLLAMTAKNEALMMEIEECRSELDEAKIANDSLKSHLSVIKQQNVRDEGSWLNLLPRRHSNPGTSATGPGNSLVSLGSWASLTAMEDDDLCCMEEDGSKTITPEAEREQAHLSRKKFLEEKSRGIRERLASKRSKVPLSPLKISQDAIESSIRETRLAIEAMKVSRSSLSRVSPEGMFDRPTL